jgi:hypothetical protein
LLLSLYVFISKGNLRSKLLFIASLLVGTLLFTVSWRLYCSITGVPFLRPFTYAIEAFQHNRSQSSSGLMLRSLISLILWVGIFPSLLLLVITIRRCRRYRKSPGIRLEDIFLWIGVVFILGYTLIGSASFGYPKYHSPAIPLLYIFVGLVLSRSKLDLLNGRSKVVFISIVVVVFAAFIIQTLVVGDLLYVYRYTLRNAIAFGLPLYPVLKSTALKMGIFSVAFIIVFVICSRALLKKAWILPLILLSVGANIGTAFLQSTANYYTGYNYGGQGTIETVQYIRQKVPLQSVVLAPSEIIYYLKLPKSPHLSNALWTDTNELTRRLTDKNTSALAYSIVTNTIQQIQTIHSNGTIQEFLHRHFRRTEIGSYIIWIRENS